MVFRRGDNMNEETEFLIMMAENNSVKNMLLNKNSSGS